jgi:hypothetical protein
MFERIKGVLRLNAPTFAEIEQDQTATTQAAIVVLLVGLLSGIGAAIDAIAFNRAAPAVAGGLQGSIEGFEAVMMPTMSPVGAFLNALIGVLLSWLIWSALTYFIGTKLFNGAANMGEMLRVVGYAQAPRLLFALSFIPCVGWIFGLVGWLWSLAASFVGIREGLDLDTGKTLLTIVVSFIAAIAVSFLLGLLLAPIFAVAA